MRLVFKRHPSKSWGDAAQGPTRDTADPSAQGRGEGTSRLIRERRVRPALVFEGVYVDHTAPALSSLQVTKPLGHHSASPIWTDEKENYVQAECGP